MPNSDPIRSLLTAMGASGTWDWNVREGRLHADARFAALYGLDPEEALAGLPTSVFFKAIHPDDRARIRIAVAGMLAGAEVFSKEFRIITPHGTVLWMHARGQSQRNDKEETERFAGLFVDVTERKRTEERLRIAQTAGGVGTFEYIDGFATATVSEEFCRLLGLHPTSTLPIQTINGVAKPGQPQIIPDARHGELPETLEAIFQVTRNEDGSERWIARRGEIVHERLGYRLIGVIYDVTAAKEQEAALRELNDTLETRVQEELVVRRQAESALRQAQKMEAVGQLTGGIAHDFNNLLMAISSSLALLQKQIPDDPRLRRMIDNAMQGTQRGAALTQRMLAFARRQDLRSEEVDIPALIDGMRELLQHTLGPEWTLVFDFPGDLPIVVGDANQLEMAILNLAVNARDAMQNGGTIRITAEDEYVSPDHASGLSEGRYLKLSVIDSGEGMDAATLERAMEPFFTTKGVGKGTGLGLSMIDGLAKQLHGTFTLTSEVGAGTIATLWLPALSHALSTAAIPPTVAEREGSSGPLKILAVDDDALILMNTAYLLEDMGHDVLEAASGAAALDILRQHPDIDLLITDQAMPNMTGTQLTERAIEMRPSLAIILATGYGELPKDAPKRMVKLGKPFDQKQLAQALVQATQREPA